MCNLDYEDDEPSGQNPVAWFVLILTAEAALGLRQSGAWVPLYPGFATLPKPLYDLRYHGELIRGWNQCLREVSAPATAPAAGDAQIDRDAAFEAVRKRLCAIPRYSFCLDDDGVVRRVEDRSGNWIEFDAAHELFDPVCVDAAIAAQRQGDA